MAKCFSPRSFKFHCHLDTGFQNATFPKSICPPQDCLFESLVFSLQKPELDRSAMFQLATLVHANSPRFLHCYNAVAICYNTFDFFESSIFLPRFRPSHPTPSRCFLHLFNMLYCSTGDRGRKTSLRSTCATFKTLRHLQSGRLNWRRKAGSMHYK